MSDDDKEEQVMERFLKWNRCPCGEVVSLTGECRYTGPLSWIWECKNGHRGHVGYTTLQEEDINLTLTSGPSYLFRR